jgi:hypothetical protein
MHAVDWYPAVVNLTGASIDRKLAPDRARHLALAPVWIHPSKTLFPLVESPPQRPRRKPTRAKPGSEAFLASVMTHFFCYTRPIWRKVNDQSQSPDICQLLRRIAPLLSLLLPLHGSDQLRPTRLKPFIMKMPFIKNIIYLLTGLLLGGLGAWSLRPPVSPEAPPTPIVGAAPQVSPNSNFNARPSSRRGDSASGPVIANLKQQNADLQKERDTLKKELDASRSALKGAEERAIFLRDVNEYLMMGTGQELPKDATETSLFAGQLRRRMAEFNEKWGENGPPEGSPERAELLREREELAADFADLSKSLAGMDLPGVVSDPRKVADFQALQLYAALELDSDTWGRLQPTLTCAYEEGFQRKLNSANRPEQNPEAWEAQRNALSQKAYTEVLNTLPADKRAQFDRLYGPQFFWMLNVGD